MHRIPRYRFNVIDKFQECDGPLYVARIILVPLHPMLYREGYHKIRLSCFIGATWLQTGLIHDQRWILTISQVLNLDQGVRESQDTDDDREAGACRRFDLSFPPQIERLDWGAKQI